MKITKFFLPYIVGLFFGYLLSIFTQDNKALPVSFTFNDLLNSLQFISIPIVICFTITILADISVLGYQKIKQSLAEKLKKLKNSIQRERKANFSPVVSLNKKKWAVETTIHFPKYAIFYSNCVATLSYNRPKIKQEKNYTSKSEYQLDVIRSVMKNYPIKGDIIWDDNNYLSKIWIGNIDILNVFTIDKSDNIFYLSRKGGKPERFWNNEKLPNLFDMSFGYGAYDFTLNITGNDMLGRRFTQTHSFFVNYGEKGFEIQNL